MGFGKRMTAKARAWVRAFFAPRRFRVVNSGEEEGLRNPSFSRRRRIAGSAGAARARRPRHNENDPVFDKIRQIHGLIPQIRAFFRQIQDPSERGKNIKSLKIKWLWKQRGTGRGYFARPRRLRASARTCSAPPSRRSRSETPRRLWRESFPKTGGSASRPYETLATAAVGGAYMAPSAGVGFASARRGGTFSSGRFREARRRPGGRPDRAGGSRARRRRPPRPRRPPPEAGIRSPGTSSPCPGGRCCARRTARASPPPAAS